MSLCRLCGDWKEPPGNPLVKYSVRHYAHVDCALTKWGAAFFDRLHKWQLGQLPYLTVARHGLAAEIDRRLA